MMKVAVFLALFAGAFCDSNQDLDSYGFIAPSAARFGRNLIIAGGYDGFTEHNQVWNFSLLGDSRGQWVEAATELPHLFDSRSFATSNVFMDYFFTFGGNSSRLELQQLRGGNEHIFYEGNGPHPRVGHSATIRDQQLYIYGGYDLVHESFSEHFWMANLEDGYIHWVLLDMEGAPGRRAGHSSVLYQESLYIFGGQDENGYFNDVWRYDFITGLWLRSWKWDGVSQHPLGRVGHVGTLWNDETYVIFGGYGTDDNGNTRFLNDMWAFDFQLGKWNKLQEGSYAGFADYSLTTPSPRAFMAYTIFNGQLIIVGGQVTAAGTSQRFWSPDTQWIDIEYPEDFAADVWSYDFNTNQWTFIKCFNASGHGDARTPDACKANNQPECPNNCSQNGVCIQSGKCICRGEWSGEDCSNNTCADGFSGYDIDTLDRILISESILNLGQKLAALKAKLEFIQEYLPEFEDFVTVVRSNPAIARMFNTTDPHAAITFNVDIALLLPILEEFNVVLNMTDFTAYPASILANSPTSFNYPTQLWIES